MLEHEPRLEKPVGSDPLARDDGVRELAHHCSQGQPGRRQDRRAGQPLTERGRDLGLPGGHGCDGVHRTCDLGMVD